jgi:hypothetical protein
MRADGLGQFVRACRFLFEEIGEAQLRGDGNRP